MGRKRHGPVQINGGSTYYARLTVPPKHRELAGKTRLIRSLQTTDHSTALKRYGVVITALEEELQQLLKGHSLRQKVDIEISNQVEEVQLLPTDAEAWWDTKPQQADAVEKAEAILRVPYLDQTNPLHNQVFESLKSNKPIPLSWEELLDLWIEQRTRKKSRGLSPESIASAKTAINQIKPYGDPTTLTKHDAQRFIDESKIKPTSIQTRCGMLSALIEAGIRKERIEINVFSRLDFNAEAKFEDERRPFTDQMLIQLYNDKSPVLWLCLTGLRPGEYASRRMKDLQGSVISVTDEPDLNWRTKNKASIRMVPKPPGLVLMKDDLKPGTRMDYMQREVKERFNNPQITPHSGRHTFYELSRRAACDPMVIEAVTGHAKKRQSSQYGTFPNEVMIRESKKVWEFVEGIVWESVK